MWRAVLACSVWNAEVRVTVRCRVPQILGDADSWLCPKCNMKVTARKTTSLYRVPTVLVQLLFCSHVRAAL